MRQTANMIVTAIRVQSRLIALLPDSLKTKGNDQELLESNHISRHQNQKEKKYIQKNDNISRRYTR